MRFSLHFTAFIIAFAIGVLYIYLSAPSGKVIYKWPTPVNAGKIVYKDATGTCYSFKAKQVSEPADKKLVRKQPINSE